MRKVREVLRLHYAAGLSTRAIARSLKVSPATVGKYIRRAEEQGLSWPLPEPLDDAALERRLFPRAGAQCDTAPVAAVERGAPRAASTGRDAGVGVAGVQGGPPRGAAVQLVLRPIPGVGLEARRGDAPGAPRRREAVRRLRRAHRRGGGPPHRGATPSAGVRRGARSVELHVCRGDVDADAAGLGRVARARIRVSWRLQRTGHSRQLGLSGEPRPSLRARHQPDLPRPGPPLRSRGAACARAKTSR